MQKSMTIVAMFAAVLVVGGCQQSDSTAGLARYPGIAQRSTMQSDALPLADTPEILPQTHFAAGMMFEEQGNIGEAIRQYRKAVALNHNYVAAYHRLGRMYSLAGKHDAAITAVARAIEIKPDSAILHNDLSFEYMFVRRWADAERSLRRAIELRPTMARSHINLALVLSKQGRFDDALVTFRQVLPEADAYYNLGLLYRGNRDYPKAADAFRHVLSINEGFAVAQTQLDEIMPELIARQPEAVEMIGPVFVESPRIVAPKIAPEDLKLTEKASRTVETPTPTPMLTLTPTPMQAKTPTPTVATAPAVARKFTVGDQGTDMLADVVRSVLSGSADVIRAAKPQTRIVERVATPLPAAEELVGEEDCDREMLVDMINDALQTKVASSKRPASSFATEDVLSIGGEVECDEVGVATPTVAKRSLLLKELERLSYNTDEEFVEIEEPKAPSVRVASVERYEDFLTDEEFIEPTPRVAIKQRPSTKWMNLPMQITRPLAISPEITYEDFVTDEEFVESVPVAIPTPVAVVEASPTRVEWDQQLVTLDELIDIMDNERRCFEETDFAQLAPEWPIVDSLAYSPANFDAPELAQTPDPWANFAQLQADLDERAQRVTEMVRRTRSQRTESKLAELEESVALMTKEVARQKAAVERKTETRRRRDAKFAAATRAKMLQKRNERIALGKTMQQSAASRTMPKASLETTREATAHVMAPTVLAGPHEPLAAAERKHAKNTKTGPVRIRAKRTAPTRRAKVVHHGVEVNWRDEFRRVNAIASIVANDVVCLNAEMMAGRDTVASSANLQDRDDSAMFERPTPTRVLGTSLRPSKNTRQR